MRLSEINLNELRGHTSRQCVYFTGGDCTRIRTKGCVSGLKGRGLCVELRSEIEVMEGKTDVVVTCGHFKTRERRGKK